jgi:uncharacterized membrane protein YfcA
MIAQLSNPWWAFVLLGICAGVLSGALGLGSGVILVPALVLLCSFGQKSAQGMALAVMVPMALVGALRYWRNPQIDLNITVIGLIVCGALAGTLAGTELAARLPSHVLRRVFAVVLVVVAVRMFVTPSSPNQSSVGKGLDDLKTANLVGPGCPNNGPEQ